MALHAFFHQSESQKAKVFRGSQPPYPAAHDVIHGLREKPRRKTSAFSQLAFVRDGNGGSIPLPRQPTDSTATPAGISMVSVSAERFATTNRTPAPAAGSTSTAPTAPPGGAMRESPSGPST